MWYLTSETDNRVVYVVPNKDITIGRSVDAQVCNFAIPNDASISRKHARLSVSENSLYLLDEGSRYGTFRNDFTVKVGINEKITVKQGDVLRFGKINSVWRVHEAKFITCTSTLKGENLQNLKLCLGHLGGILKSDWDDSCVYLTMPAITLTVKVVLALAQAAHIVTTDFWVNCKEAVKNQTSLPDPSNFVPQVVESTLNKDNVTFLPNEERKSLFSGKTFIFFSRRQLEMYKVVLVKCSATALLLSDTMMTKTALCEPGVIVIQYNLTNISQETQAQRNQINDIINYLKNKGKRVIADAEIGLAILYCSSDKYCNPDFNFSSEVMKQTPGQDKAGKVLAQESQEPTQKLGNQNVIINESLTPVSSKRRLTEEDEFETSVNKKFAAELPVPNTATNESVKRKHSDENGISNPNKKMAIENEDDNIFNFLNNSTDTAKQTNDENLLSFIKPAQKSQNMATNDEDNLFNFVQDPSKETDNSSKGSTLFSETRINYIKKEIDAESLESRKHKVEDDVIDLTALRGSKLKELMEMQSKWSTDDMNNIKIKKEDPDDLDQKMRDLELSTSVITVRKNLIVKREHMEVEDKENIEGSAQKNFKTFKKVWPIKRQLNVIPKSAMSIMVPDSVSQEITSQSY